MSGKKYLVINLEGPMQSWGLYSKFDLRSTETLPTKSGIIGLIAAAFGYSRNDTKAISKLTVLKMAAICTQEGQIEMDFQTVGAGYDKIPLPERLLYQLPTAEGGRKNAVTKRFYLFDYQFKVILWGDDELIKKCSDALTNPIYGGFLGRKSCLPSKPLVDGIFDTSIKVINHLKQTLSSVAQKREKPIRNIDDCRLLCEVKSGGFLIRDVPTNFQDKNDVVRKVTDEELILNW
jgi:CRISPR system Cascade subunit CasD